MKIRIGVMCPSNIAYRRFLPALQNCKDFEYIGVAYATPEEWFENDALGKDTNVLEGERQKADRFKQDFGGRVFAGYENLINSPDIDAVYLPLPPALHYKWGKKALLAGKHIFMEKPFTVSEAQTRELIDLAQEKDLAVHENYMFIYHKQIAEIQRIIKSGELGEVRLARASFGFPFRGADDFRYNKALGGGALLDCGGYPIRIVRLLLGDTVELVDGCLAKSGDFDVDLYGNAVLRNADGCTAHIAFGMDNCYQCRLEVWGSKATLIADRVFTPPADMAPKLVVQSNDGISEIEVEPDDQFKNSIQKFKECFENVEKRSERYKDIIRQSRMIEELRNGGRKNASNRT